MDKLAELKAMADSIGFTVELKKTDDREVYYVYQDGKEIAKGSYEAVKVKLEDFIDMKNMKDVEGKIKELLEAGKTDEEIINIMSDYLPPEGWPMPEDVVNSSAVQSALEDYSESVIYHLNMTHHLEFTDLAIDELKKVVADATAKWYTESMNVQGKIQAVSDEDKRLKNMERRILNIWR